jgi:hypothetical protein
MKSVPDPDTTPAQKFQRFQDGLRQVLTVSKKELLEREKQYKADSPRRIKRRASGHVSDAKP